MLLLCQDKPKKLSKQTPPDDLKERFLSNQRKNQFNG
jgi:hypothetical protein